MPQTGTRSSRSSTSASTSAAASVVDARDFVLAFLNELEATGLRYCHWKGNHDLRAALAGQGDLDLLVDEGDLARFVSVLEAHGFKRAESVITRQQPGVSHRLALDPASGRLINVHLYSRILLGDEFVESWALPVERMLLDEARMLDGVRVPSKAAELAVFVLRHMLRHATPMDLWLIGRRRSASAAQLDWLLDGVDPSEAAELVGRHLPEISAADFGAALEASREPKGAVAMLWLGRRFARLLRRYRRYSRFTAPLRRIAIVARMAYNRAWLGRKHMTLPAGGKIVALVGPQATGKSTLGGAVSRCLASELAVWMVHVGKPPSTALSWIPNRLVPLARRLFRRQATRAVDARVDQEEKVAIPFIYVIRKLLLAHDRRKLLRRADRLRRQGGVVICDRYPADNRGAIDGASFPDTVIEAQKSKLKRLLMRWEGRIYDRVLPPDLVIELTVSVEEAVKRNLVRNKDIPQDTAYVRQRHAMRVKPRFDRCPVVAVRTDRDIGDTTREVQEAVWRVL